MVIIQVSKIMSLVHCTLTVREDRDQLGNQQQPQERLIAAVDVEPADAADMADVIYGLRHLVNEAGYDFGSAGFGTWEHVL